MKYSDDELKAMSRCLLKHKEEALKVDHLTRMLSPYFQFVHEMMFYTRCTQEYIESMIITYARLGEDDFEETQST